MPIPQFHEIFLPLLRRSADGRAFTLAVVRGPTANESSLTDAERSGLLPNIAQAPFASRRFWARASHERAGGVARVRCGVFAVFDAGLACRPPWAAQNHHVASMA